MNLELEKLNKAQKKAVTHGEGPLLIVAGAGTGKTTVITKRLAWLIKEGMAEPEEILALTFTDKAAGEMEERVDRLLTESYLDLWVMTFHSFAHRVLKEKGFDVGLPTDFNLLDETDSWLLVRKNLGKFDLDYYKPLGRPTKFIHALVSHFSKCKDQGIYPEDYLNYSKKVEEREEKKRLEEVARAYRTYQEILLSEDSLDFGDLINYAIRLFEQRKNILKEYRKRFKFVLVDEFQDTNRAQYDLMKILAAPRNNLTVTADDDQAIYRFRGASFGNIIQFKKDYPDSEVVSIVENYRSRQNILDLAHRLIQNNNPNRLEVKEDVSKKLVANKKGEGAIEHLHYKTLEGEAQGVAKKIIELKDGGTDFKDFGILVRSNSMAQPFCRALERAGVPYSFLAVQGLYFEPIILDAISYFKILDNYHESDALYRVLNIPPLGFSQKDAALLTREAHKRSRSLYAVLKNPPSGISDRTRKKVEELLSLIRKHTKLSRRRNVSEVFVSFLEETGYLDYLTRANDLKSIKRVNEFYSKIKAFEEANRDASLPNFMRELDLELESGEEGRLDFNLEEEEGVRIMTIHKAKGLEFKYVFIPNLVKRRFPTINRRDPIEIPEELVRDIIPEGDVHLEEERRLFYVAMTRAKKGLFFTSGLDYGGVRKKRPSRFLKEVGMAKEEADKAEGIEKRKKKEKKKKEALPFPTYFSYTQFRAFESCPLQYKYAHILKIPIRGKAFFSYGRTMHNTLERFMRAREKKSLSLDDLLRIYEEEWIDNWFDDKEEKERYKRQGGKSLKLFYERTSKKDPRVLKIKGEPALELSFRLKIKEESVIGKIDRIDKVEDGVELVDYKTGRPREKLKKEDKEQLLIYQMAAEEALGLSPARLTYYYLDGGKTLSFLGSEEEKEKQKQKMREVIKRVKESDFHPEPGWQCKFCDFKRICEYAKF